MSDSDPFGELKKRLISLEGHLKTLSAGMDEDLRTARELQKYLIPNRTPEVTGLKTYARYIGGGELSSESFDLIPSKDGKELWIVTLWSESFGLSSVLLQALVHLQTTALLSSRTKLSSMDVFNELSASASGARKSGRYRLSVTRIDTTSLECEGTSIGFAPWFRRRQSAGGWSGAEPVQAEALNLDPALIQPANSAAPRLAADAYAYRFHAGPGTRTFFFTHAWAPESGRLEEIIQPLKLSEAPAKTTGDLAGDMNAVTMRAQDAIRASGFNGDLTMIAFEVDAKKLHLA